jgi:hypothetical protein
MRGHTTYGHADAKVIRRTRWAIERAAVRALLDSNSEHEGQRQALRWLEALTQKAVANEQAFKGAEELARLHRHCITSLDILAEVCAVHAWLDSNHTALPDDRSRDFLISHGVFQLAPRPRNHFKVQGRETSSAPKPRASALNYIGRHFRLALSVFMVNVARNAATPEQAAEKLKAAMSAPMRIVGPSTKTKVGRV